MLTTEPSARAFERRNTRRYVAQMLATMGGYAALLVLTLLWLRRDPPPPWRFAIALLPMLPLALVPLIVLRAVRRMDELWRRIHLEALAFAFPVGLLLATAYGFLQLAG